jgi:hypothetical protein
MLVISPGISRNSRKIALALIQSMTSDWSVRLR